MPRQFSQFEFGSCFVSLTGDSLCDVSLVGCMYMWAALWAEWLKAWNRCDRVGVRACARMLGNMEIVCVATCCIRSHLLLSSSAISVHLTDAECLLDIYLDYHNQWQVIVSTDINQHVLWKWGKAIYGQRSTGQALTCLKKWRLARWTISISSWTVRDSRGSSEKANRKSYRSAFQHCQDQLYILSHNYST